MARDRTRDREPEPEPRSSYEKVMDHFEQVRNRADNPYVVREGDVPWESTPQGRIKYYSYPYMDDAVLPKMAVFRHEIRTESGRHTHQGGITLFALEGEGETLVDDERVQWKAGDLIILPVKPGGVTHQHFNRNDPDEPATWLAIIYFPDKDRLGGQFTQNKTAPDWDAHTEDVADHDHDHETDSTTGFSYDDWLAYEPPAEPETLHEDLIVRRNRYRQEVARARDQGYWAKLEPGDTEWEWNRQGRMRWYLHPAFDNRSIKSYLYAVQEIPPGSRSGKQHRQGGVVHYVLQGEGHTVVDGERHEWGEDSYLGTPVKPDGVTVQHFNDSPDEPARFIVCEPGLFRSYGLDLGCGYDQLTSCPEYEG